MQLLKKVKILKVNSLNFNLYNLISQRFNKTRNFINIDELYETGFIIEYKNKFFGPFFISEKLKSNNLRESLILKKELNFNIKDLNEDEVLFLLKIKNNKFKSISITLKFLNKELYSLKFCDQCGDSIKINSKVKEAKFNYFYKLKLDLDNIYSVIDNKEYLIKYINDFYEFIFNEVFCNFLNNLKNTIIFIEYDKKFSVLPFELINYKLWKEYNSLFIFIPDFLINYENFYISQNTLIYQKYSNITNNNYRIEEKEVLYLNNILKENKKTIFSYSDPDDSFVKDIFDLDNLKNIDFQFINDNKGFISILRNYKNIIFSGHGVLKDRVNSIIINSTIFNPDLIDNIKIITDTILFNCCFLTFGYLKKNLLCKLFLRGLKVAIFNSFKLIEEIGNEFMKNYISLITKEISPFISYLYSLDRNLENYSYFFKFSTLMKKYILLNKNNKALFINF